MTSVRRRVAESWNRTAFPFDYLVVDCQTVREAISALLDDEDPEVPRRVVDDHLGTCAACRRWQDAVHAVTRSTRLGPARPLSLGSDELIAAVHAGSRPPRRPTSFTLLRATLALVGAAQVAATAPLLLFGRDHAAPEHVAHEVGAFAVALGVGLLLAAWKPDRARGMHALVGAVAALLVVTALVDLLHGRTDVGDEAPHLLALVGWVLLLRVAAAAPSPSADPSWSRLSVVRVVTGRRAQVGAFDAAGVRAQAEAEPRQPPGRRRAG